MNKAVLLQQQLAKAQADRELQMTKHMKELYDNISYEDNEPKQAPDATSEHSYESHLEYKEEKIDRF